MSEDEITTLNGIDTGRYIVTTHSGTCHTIDLDRMTAVRDASVSGHVWDEAGIGLGKLTPDGEVFSWNIISNATVGERMVLENFKEWRVTSVVRSIERADGRRPI
jgi:hypothetical protein